MVEGEGGGESVEREPAGVGCVVAGGGEGRVLEAGTVDDGDGAAAGIAVGVAVGADMLQRVQRNAGLFAELPARGVRQVLVRLHESARNGPARRRAAAPHQEHPVAVLERRDDHRVGADGIAGRRRHGATRRTRRPRGSVA